MALTFPNSSRSYDPDGQRIRFVGHDGMFQISFSISLDAISKRTFDVNEAEARYLNAFDEARKSIQDMAKKAYERTGRAPMRSRRPTCN